MQQHRNYGRMRFLTPQSEDGTVPLSLFAQSNHPLRLETLHPFGWPAFILENAMQQGNKIGRWKNRSRMGMYHVNCLHMPDLYTLSYQSIRNSVTQISRQI